MVVEEAEGRVLLMGSLVQRKERTRAREKIHGGGRRGGSTVRKGNGTTSQRGQSRGGQGVVEVLSTKLDFVGCLWWTEEEDKKKMMKKLEKRLLLRGCKEREIKRRAVVTWGRKERRKDYYG